MAVAITKTKNEIKTRKYSILNLLSVVAYRNLHSHQRTTNVTKQQQQQNDNKTGNDDTNDNGTEKLLPIYKHNI